MKTLTRFIVTSVVILLLGVSLASGHGGSDDSDQTGSRDDMMSGTQMQDMSQHMVINGTITVEDSILLTLTVSPSEEMQQEMDDHMGSGNHMDGQHMDEYSNTITVSLFELVEFEDSTGNGYSSDDSILSGYTLNSTNLNDPEVTDDSRYTITSDDSIFKMDIDMKFEEDLFNGFKWSVEINYMFESNTSQLAMLHEISTPKGPMMERHQVQNGATYSGAHMQYEERYMNDHDEHLPMFFSWAEEVEVDGRIAQVTASSEDSLFAIAVPQGDNIVYDPEIGADVNAIQEMDAQFGSFMEQIQDFLGPVATPLGMVVVALVSFLVISTITTYRRQ